MLALFLMIKIFVLVAAFFISFAVNASFYCPEEIICDNSRLHTELDTCKSKVNNEHFTYKPGSFIEHCLNCGPRPRVHPFYFLSVEMVGSAKAKYKNPECIYYDPYYGEISRPRLGLSGYDGSGKRFVFFPDFEAIETPYPLEGWNSTRTKKLTPPVCRPNIQMMGNHFPTECPFSKKRL